MTEEEEFAQYWAGQLGKKAPAPAETADKTEEEEFAEFWRGTTPAPAVEEPAVDLPRSGELPTGGIPGALFRARTHIEQGLGRAMDRLTGEDPASYSGAQIAERAGLESPLEDQFMDTLTSRIPAAANEVGAAAGQIMGEVIPDPVKRGLVNTMEWMGRNRDKHPIYSQSGKFTEEGEVWLEGVRDAAALGSVGMNRGVPRLTNAGARAKARLDAGTKARANERTIRLLDEGDLWEGGNQSVETTGWFRKWEKAATDEKLRMSQELNDIPEFNPSGDLVKNVRAADKRVSDLRLELDARIVEEMRRADAGLSQVQYFDQHDLIRMMENVERHIGKNPDLVGDASKVANRIMNKVDIIVDRRLNLGPGGVPLKTPRTQLTPLDLLEVRRELDGWLRASDTKIFDAMNQTGKRGAAKAIRREINQMVENAVPGVQTQELLRRQSDLLSAIDIMKGKADTMSVWGPMRGLQQVEETTGIMPPRSPLAVEANLGSPKAVAGSLVVGAGVLGHRAAMQAARVAATRGVRAGSGLVNSMAALERRLAAMGLVSDNPEDEVQVPYRR